LDSQNSPQPELGGSHHLPLYSIFYVYPWDQHPNVILSRDSQVGVPKFPQLGLPQLWGPMILREDLRLRWGLKKNYNFHREISNGISHAIWTQGNRGNFWLLVVGNQIANLTPDPSFGPNLCFRCPNGLYRPILNIQVPRDFQWYKKLLNPLGFDPCSYSLKIQESTRTPTPKVEAPLGVWGFIPSHFPSFSGFLLGPQLCKPSPWSWA
jgi:hypothetical protein